MSSQTEDSPIARVETSARQLSAAAINLNSTSDQLGKVVAILDSAFQKLNIGVSGWVKFRDAYGGPDGMHFWTDEVGYAKVSGKWGITIRSASGREGDDDYGSYEEWLFNDAPRALRLKAIEKIPDLFEQLTSEVTATAKATEVKLKELEEFASVVNAVVTPDAKPAAKTTNGK